jgi:hypothetical protein
MYFPHVINGRLSDANYTTVIGVTNLSTSPQSVTLTFNPNEGPPITASRTIPGNGSLRETAETLFQLSSAFENGWVHISGTAAFSGFAAYADTVSGGFSVVPAGNAQSNLFFSHIADGPPQWQTGIALLNAGTTAADVEVYALDPGGALIGSTSLTVEPGRKIAKTIHELIGKTRGVNGGFAFVRSTNNVPLYGIELFYTEDLKVLSQVAAGRPTGGVVYVPPTP